MAPRPQLLTYPDSLGGDLRALGDLLDGPLAGVFRGVHVLPPFPSSGDRGFAPLTYDRIDPRFGTWDDIGRIAARPRRAPRPDDQPHLAPERRSSEDFQRHGRESASADLFITLDKVWPDGQPPAADVARIFLRKPDAPFSTVTIEDTGEQERIWTSFGTADWSEQIDLDVTSPATRALITRWLRQFAERGVRIVRLDAVGYVIKKPGTTCFMVEPEIYEFLDWVTDVAGFVRARHPARGPRRSRDPRAAVGARLLDLRLRPARPAAPRLRDRATRSAWPSTWPRRRTGSSRTSTATTASRSAPTSTGS